MLVVLQGGDSGLGWRLWRWKSLVRLKDILSWHDFSPLSSSSGFLGEESSLYSCQGHVLWRTDGLWNSSQESHWTAPGPQGFLESIQQWQFINNDNELITFPSKHLLAITLFVTPTDPTRCVREEKQGFLLQFYYRIGRGQLIGTLKITQKMLVWGSESSFLASWIGINPLYARLHTNSPNILFLQTISHWELLNNLQDLSFLYYKMMIKIATSELFAWHTVRTHYIYLYELISLLGYKGQKTQKGLSKKRRVTDSWEGSVQGVTRFRLIWIQGIIWHH